MKQFAGGLLVLVGLLVLTLKAANMLLAWLLLTFSEWLNGLDVWLNQRAARIGGFKIPPEQRSTKDWDDIMSDFAPEQRREYEHHAGAGIAHLAVKHSENWVYWDLHDFTLK